MPRTYKNLLINQRAVNRYAVDATGRHLTQAGLEVVNLLFQAALDNMFANISPTTERGVTPVEINRAWSQEQRQMLGTYEVMDDDDE